ncbi:MAG TPA: 50S ribosomal protein L25 [Acidimicrobiaceae bacterium]|nr:50S ribosomal protein L25 [Acidimicrobiaceae bacterium]
MEQLKLRAEARTNIGSRYARRLRRQDKIPAVMYGRGGDSVALTLDRLRFRAALNAAGPNAIITLEHEGTTHLTIVKDMQRDTIANRVTHIDLLRISLDERLVVDVPIHLEGEAVTVGRQGGVVQQQLMTLAVESPAGVIPPTLNVDISELSIEEPIRVGDVELPEGMVSQVPDDTLVVIGQRSRAAVAAEVEDEEAEIEGEEAEGEEAEGEEAEGDEADAGSD